MRDRDASTEPLSANGPVSATGSSLTGAASATSAPLTGAGSSAGVTLGGAVSATGATLTGAGSTTGGLSSSDAACAAGLGERSQILIDARSSDIEGSGATVSTLDAATTGERRATAGRRSRSGTGRTRVAADLLCLLLSKRGGDGAFAGSAASAFGLFLVAVAADPTTTNRGHAPKPSVKHNIRCS